MERKTTTQSELARRYKAGLCSPREIQEIRNWYDSFETDGYPLQSEQEIERASLEAAVSAINEVRFRSRKLKVRRMVVPILKVAAILVLLCAAGILYKPSRPVAETSFQEISTLPGEKKRVTLPDGSAILLNSASRLRFPVEFTGSIREVRLQGEAFFEVAHDSVRPFIVRTERLKVQVLGTSFAVSAYRQDQQATVAVATGKVGVTSRTLGSRTQLLNPGELVSYDKSQGSFRKRRVLVAEVGNWRKNIVDFDFETLEVIASRLERIYGVDFTFRDKAVMRERFRLRAENESLANIMRLLSISGNGFRYKISGKQVIVGLPGR